MGDVKMTAEERIRKLQFYAEWSANGHGGDVVHFDDAIHVAEEHAAAAVEPWKARVAELETALRGLAARYHRDAHEGDGIPEDAHEWDTAQRVLGKVAVWWLRDKIHRSVSQRTRLDPT